MAAPEGGATGAKLRASAAELLAEVERLRAENEALRAALADLQSSDSEAETLPLETGAEAGAAHATAAPAEPVKTLAEQLEEGIRWPSPEEGNFWERPPRAAPLPLAPPAGGGARAVARDPRAFHVVHITGTQAPPQCGISLANDRVLDTWRFCSAFSCCCPARPLLPHAARVLAKRSRDGAVRQGRRARRRGDRPGPCLPVAGAQCGGHAAGELAVSCSKRNPTAWPARQVIGVHTQHSALSE